MVFRGSHARRLTNPNVILHVFETQNSNVSHSDQKFEILFYIITSFHFFKSFVPLN